MQNLMHPHQTPTLEKKRTSLSLLAASAYSLLILGFFYCLEGHVKNPADHPNPTPSYSRAHLSPLRSSNPNIGILKVSPNTTSEERIQLALQKFQERNPSVGPINIPLILQNKPYNSLEDFQTKNQIDGDTMRKLAPLLTF